MIWKNEDNRILFFKSKTNLGLHHVAVTTPKTSRENHAPSVVELQQVPDSKKSVPKEESSFLKVTYSNGRREVIINFKTDTDIINVVMYRY